MFFFLGSFLLFQYCLPCFVQELFYPEMYYFMISKWYRIPINNKTFCRIYEILNNNSEFLFICFCFGSTEKFIKPNFVNIWKIHLTFIFNQMNFIRYYYLGLLVDKENELLYNIILSVTIIRSLVHHKQ